MDTYQPGSGPNKTFVFILGLVIGALILGISVYVYTNFFSPNEGDSSKFTVTPTKEFALSTTSPLDNDTVSTETVKINGNTGVSSIVVINGGIEDTIITTASGVFSVDYKLALGENQITLTAYDEKSGESTTKTLNLLYLNEDLDSL